MVGAELKMLTSWWRRSQAARVRLLVVGCTFVALAFGGPPVVRLFVRTERQNASVDWGWLAVGLGVAVRALIRIRRIGWRDD